MKNAIEVTLASFAKPAAAIRPKLSVLGVSEDRQELLHTLMDTYVKNDVLSIQQSIINRECRKSTSWLPFSGRLHRVAVNMTVLASICPARCIVRCTARRWHAAATLVHPSPRIICLFSYSTPADVEYTIARSRYKFDDLEAYMATAYSVRDRLIEEWNDTQ